MSNKQDLETVLPELEAISSKEILKPDMPIDTYLQEAEDLADTANEDKEQLTARGLMATVISQLPIAIGACREAETKWFNERYQKQEAEKVWKEQSPLAYDLRNELISEFEYAFYGDSALIARIDDIKKGGGHADMIQDLSNLAGLGERNASLLSATNFDASKLTLAAEYSDTMAKILARANGDKGDNNEAKVLRDKTYTYLKKHVDEIRRCGKFVFRNHENRIVKYQSSYYRNK